MNCYFNADYKISLILTGPENKELLDNCINLNFYGNNTNSQVIPLNEFDEVKNRVLKKVFLGLS